MSTVYLIVGVLGLLVLAIFVSGMALVVYLNSFDAPPADSEPL